MTLAPRGSTFFHTHVLSHSPFAVGCASHVTERPPFGVRLAFKTVHDDFAFEVMNQIHLTVQNIFLTTRPRSSGRTTNIFERQIKMQLAQVDFSKLQLSQLQTGKGVKTAAAPYNGAPCKFLLSSDEWFAAPFGASAYQDPQATRLTMELDVTDKAVQPLLQAVDRWAVKFVTDNKLFGDMSAEDIAKQYHPCLQFSEKYNAHRVRTKINTEGLNSCKWFRHPDKESTSFASLDLRQSILQPVIHLKGIWKQSNQWGMSLDTIKALVDANGSDTWEF